MSKWKTLLAFVLLFPFLPLQVVAQQPHPVGSLEMIDDTGTKLGIVIGKTQLGLGGEVMGPPLVVVEIEGRLLPIYVGRDRFVGTESVLYFTSTDCMGPALAEYSGSPFPERLWLFQVGASMRQTPVLLQARSP